MSRRQLSCAGAAGLLALCLCAPATAQGDGGAEYRTYREVERQLTR